MKYPPKYILMLYSTTFKYTSVLILMLYSDCYKYANKYTSEFILVLYSDYTILQVQRKGHTHAALGLLHQSLYFFINSMYQCPPPLLEVPMLNHVPICMHHYANSCTYVMSVITAKATNGIVVAAPLPLTGEGDLFEFLILPINTTMLTLASHVDWDTPAVLGDFFVISNILNPVCGNHPYQHVACIRSLWPRSVIVLSHDILAQSCTPSKFFTPAYIILMVRNSGVQKVSTKPTPSNAVIL
mmetsp:Transcript_22689/g.49712  ORF Transcript_22689/g.49712 Transcript_22689/m.49712 type:complete len:242 (+) Transcript_22689:57-782(+)